jgi:hypothetical protein
VAGPVHALQTLRKIDAMIEADQGSAYRGWLGRVLPHIGDAYRTDEDGFRSHLGASVLGGECARAIWLGFRWSSKASFEGRILRLFNRGHLEEGRIIAALLMIGAQVYQQDANGKQFRISWAGGHAGGSGDGVAVAIPDLAPDLPCLLEFKTHGEKSFIELSGKLVEWRKYVAGKGSFTGKGLKAVKPEHYIQMQVYMRKMGIAVGLYVAVNKNTDDLYMELITLDTELAEQFMYRGEQIVFADRAPAKINESAGFFKCVFCNERPVCQLGADPAINCRTCQFSKPLADGSWLCNKHNMPLPKEKQQVGCPDWYRNDDL